jgi:hypothetical protein
MLKVQNPVQDETFSALMSMGYKPEIINLAFEDSKNKSLEEVLDLLICREDYYNKNSQNRPKKDNKIASMANIFDEFGNNGGKQRRKNSNKTKNKNDEKKPAPAPKKDSFKENDERIGQPSEPVVALLPKVMDDESALYFNTIRKSLNHIDSKDPNEYVTVLSDHLKAIKFNSSGAGQTIQKFLLSGSQFSQVVDLRKKIYEVVTKVMTMKRQGEVNIQEFEYVLLMGFEHRLLNVKQMDQVLSSYSKFCTKARYNQDDILVSSLERYYTEAKKAQNLPGGPTVQDYDNYLMSDIAVMKCPNVTNVKQVELEESKLSDNIEKPKKNGRSEKEFCVVCTEKTREIVFLPCCHFLTCPDCSPQVMKCPICFKKVEKNLKIFWS